MKTILCFGDSNTWGYNPRDCGRYDPEIRWPGVVRKKLGQGFLVVEEGLNGRTTVWDDPIVAVNRSGKAVLPVCLETHKPLDLVIIMLGTNDLKLQFSLPAVDIAKGAGLLLDLVSYSKAGPKETNPFCLLISPPYMGEEPAFDGMFDLTRNKSKQLAPFYKREVDLRQG
ncbi:MAG: arylesterase, partial [Spirochaetales bacterium]|nr:arylesterase [Spirochaetales bacterium]